LEPAVTAPARSAAGVGRFAPSTTGPAHPGTLLAALLCWLDARTRGDALVLRLEDLDPQRCRPEWADAMQRDLEELGLEFDRTTLQSENREAHEAALDTLAERGVLYRCRCTRKTLRDAGATPDGGRRYPGTCRALRVDRGSWRAVEDPLRVELAPGRLEIRDESGLSLSQDPEAEMGDPLVRRRDGAMAYHLASVVDDGEARVTRIVRGRDLASTTATQAALRALLELPVPAYRHHLLLLEVHGTKLAKLHGSVDREALRARYTSAELVGVLAHAAGLLSRPEPTSPADLREDFSWERVATDDRVLGWDGQRLALRETGH
jgi:glutamyl/glutaminyl-tRNA synthetase